MQSPETSRVAIIGAGSVGSTCAYSLLLRRVASEILLVDTDSVLLHAQVQDLEDAAFLSNTAVREATLAEAGQCNIVVVTAGAKQRPGETRRGLIDRNHAILKSVIAGMAPMRRDAILLIVSNPVDVLTHFAQAMSGLPNGQVIGSGTFLDTTRLRSMVAGHTKVRLPPVGPTNGPTRDSVPYDTCTLLIISDY
jgi:L-lactate dehydrogenase